MGKFVKFRLGVGYGSLPGVVSTYYVYGSAEPGAIDIHRGSDRTKGPIGRAYYTPKGGWFVQWYVVREGLGKWHEEFKIRLATHMAPYVEAAAVDSNSR